MALRARHPDVRLFAFARREETVRAARERGLADVASTDPADILPHADLTVLCMPISATIDFACRHAAAWQKGSLVTDVGSVKREVLESCAAELADRGVHFVGSHPMAGKESAGLDAAEADLYRDAVVFLCGEERVPAEVANFAKAFWRAVGARAVSIGAEQHDRLVARSSHVLHLAAASLARLLPRDPMAEFATAGSFRDMTRVAASSPAMWTDICAHNRESVREVLDELIAGLSDLRDCVAEERWDGLRNGLEEGRERRLDWNANAGGGTLHE